MSNLIVSEFLSLDGIMQSPGAPDEDPSGGFEHGGWQMPYLDEAAGKVMAAGMAATGGFLLGHKTYEIFAGFWPSQPDDDPFAATLNSLPKYVASTTLREPLAWRNATLLKGGSPRRSQGSSSSRARTWSSWAAASWPRR